MGYTHYWDDSKEPASQETIDQFYSIFDVMVKMRPNTIEIDERNYARLWFNGIDDLAHETMCIDFTGKGTWQFCKTARKPYDELVVACLILAEELGIIQGWSSDGDEYDHGAGWRLLETAKPLANVTTLCGSNPQSKE
jgi:hypothetical protein